MQFLLKIGTRKKSRVHSNRKISIVIITYNSEKYIEKCLSSILKYNKDIIDDIIIADNNSQDETLNIIKNKFPIAKILKLDNIGYGAALNEGLKICKNEYMIASNDDIYFIDKSLSKIFDTFETNQEIGIVGPKLLNPDFTLQQSITNYPSILKDFLQIIFPKLLNSQNKVVQNIFSFFSGIISVGRFDTHHESKSVQSVKGAFMIFKKNVFKQSGGFDNRIKFIGEEQVFSFRAKKNGFKTFYEKNINVVHIGGQSLGGATTEINIKRFGIKFQSNLIFFKFYKSMTIFYFAYVTYFTGFLIRYLFLLITLNNSKKTLLFLISLMIKNKLLTYNFYKEK
jgi:GT2 family glycosyltransferase